MNYERRRLLQFGSAAAIAAFAGCSSGDSDDGDGGDDGDGTDDDTGSDGDDGGTNDGEDGDGQDGDGDGMDDDQTPGRDQLGGPNDLQASAEVDAITLDGDEGAGQYVNTPAVVWLEAGGTITWSIENGSHSVTAYHPEYGKEMRIPVGATPFDSTTLPDGETFSHTFDETGVYNYYCRPHEGLGMVGLVIVGEPGTGPGTTAPDAVESSTAADNLGDLLDVAGIEITDGTDAQTYGWEDATWDSYWYSLYTMSTNIAMAGNGIPFPANDQMAELRDQRMPQMLEAADTDRPPINNPNLTLAAFTEGDPHFTQQPIFEDETGRPNAETLAWDKSAPSGVVSPSSVAWTHLKGVTWAKNFQQHFDILPPVMAAKFRAQLLTTLAQVGINATILTGGPNGDGMLTRGDTFEFISGVNPAEGAPTDGTSRPHHHAAMLWFLADLTSLAQNGWFGYVNPIPLIPAEEGDEAVFDPPIGIQGITDAVAQTTMNLFDAGTVAEMESTRSVGLMLAAVGYYGPQAGNDDLRSAAADYANALAGVIDENLADDGRVANSAANQAATQGIVAQGLLWASELDGVDHTDTAESVLDYLLDDLWDAEAGTFMSGADDDIYTITARDAGDITGGLNAADAVLGMDGAKDTFAEFFNQTFNRGRLQRAERPQSRDENAEFTLPLPPMAGGDFGQAAVYNAEIAYDPAADEWTVTDDRFDTEGALYLANQDIWVAQWGGDFYQGRGRPGQSDEPPA